MKLQVFIAALAVFIMSISTTALASPTLSFNSKGNDVTILQQTLKDIGYKISVIDGEFGNETKSAVEAFQRDNELEVTGVVNNATWRALRTAEPLEKKSETEKDNSNSNVSESKTADETTVSGQLDETKPTSLDKIKIDSKGNDVTILQQKLKDIGYKITSVDGEFGNETKAAVEAFQRDNELKVTGVVNNATWRVLMDAKPIEKKSETTKSTSSSNVPKSNTADEAAVSGQLKEDKLVPLDKIKIGSKGSNVTILQQTLKNIGYKITSVDGEFGNETKAAVEAFQHDNELKVTGVVNKATWRALMDAEPLEKKSKTAKVSNSETKLVSLDKVKINSTGNDVMILQQTLKDIGYNITMVDGEFGNETKAAVEAFQRDNELKVTGVVNKATWRALRDAEPLKNNSKTVKNTSRQKSSNDIVDEDIANGQFNDGKLVPFGKTLLNKSQAATLVKTAKKYIGAPYVFGGASPKGFDCSGFLQYVFKENGILIPRLADDQYKLGKRASTDELTAGDLVFFTTYEAGASHCGIYLGEGKFLHTSSSKGVRIDLLNNGYWAPKFYGAKKIVEV